DRSDPVTEPRAARHIAVTDRLGDGVRPAPAPLQGARTTGRKQRKRGPNMPRGLTYALKLTAVSALTLAISFGRVEMASAYYQADSTQLASDGGRDKGDHSKDKEKGGAGSKAEARSE